MDTPTEKGKDEMGVTHDQHTDEIDGMAAEAIPDDDWYTRYICTKPWTAWATSLISILLFVGIGVGITMTTREFALSGATVGFESRGTEKAGETFALDHMARLECLGEITLRADGAGSKYYNGDAEYESDDPEVQVVVQASQPALEQPGAALPPAPHPPADPIAESLGIGADHAAANA